MAISITIEPNAMAVSVRMVHCLINLLRAVSDPLFFDCINTWIIFKAAVSNGKTLEYEGALFAGPRSLALRFRHSIVLRYYDYEQWLTMKGAYEVHR